MNVLALCSGVGGLELGLGLATGGRARAVCYVERDAYAAAVLMARMEDEALGRAPVWDDLATFDARAWRGVVDCVAAGFPCQPWSVAGKRKGLADDRWIWPGIVRIIGECEPGLVFLENVPGLYRHGLRAVLSDLAEIGFDAEWTSVRASDVGAPHRRERVFIMAYRNEWRRGRVSFWAELQQSTEGGSDVADRQGGSSWGARSGSETPDDSEHVAHRDAAIRDEPGRRDGASGTGATESRYAGAGLADSEHARRGLGRAAHNHDGRDASRHDADGCDAPVGDTDRAGCIREQSKAHEGWSQLKRGFGFPPGPGDTEAWRDYLRAGGPEPAIRRGSDGIPDRLDRLRCLGNAVVPQQAALAFRVLYERVNS